MPWRFPFRNRRWLGPSIGKRFFLEWTLIGMVGVAAVLFEIGRASCRERV